MRRYLLTGVIVILITVGVQADIFDYFKDRGTDLMDIFLFRVSAARKAKAIGARIRVTALAQVGAVYFEGDHFGLDRRGIGMWKERRIQGGLSLLSFATVENDVVWGNYYLDENSAWMNFEERGLIRNNTYWDDGREHPFSINAEIQPGLLPGCEVGIYPMEILDFITGLFTLDPQNDDLVRVLKYSPEYTKPLELFPETEEFPEELQDIILKTEPLPLETEQTVTSDTLSDAETKLPPSVSENNVVPEIQIPNP